MDGDSVKSPYTSDYLSTSGSVEVVGRATDSRGIYKEISKDITVIPYSSPKLIPASGESGIICARCDENGTITDEGTYLKIKAKRSYSKVMSGDTQKNFCAIQYRYRSESTNKFSDWVTILSKSNTDTNTINSKPIANVVSSTEKSYIVQIGVIDDIGDSATIQFIVPTAFIAVDIPEDKKGKVIGIFRYASDEHDDGENHIDMDGFLHGGGVDNLTIGTKLTATAEAHLSLNDVKTPGCYYSPNAENSQYISDSPYTGGGFGLEVRDIQNSTYKRQEIYFGRTRWTRHWNGEEWSNWLRYLMTSQDDNSTSDFVIESGEKDGWTYKKWKSGTYEMFGYFEVTPTESTKLDDRNVYRTNSIGIKAPFKISKACASGTVQGYCWLSNSGISEDHEYVAIRLLSTEAISTSSSYNVRLAVMGNYE